MRRERARLSVVRGSERSKPGRTDRTTQGRLVNSIFAVLLAVSLVGVYVLSWRWAAVLIVLSWIGILGLKQVRGYTYSLGSWHFAMAGVRFQLSGLEVKYNTISRRYAITIGAVDVCRPIPLPRTAPQASSSVFARLLRSLRKGIIAASLRVADICLVPAMVHAIQHIVVDVAQLNVTDQASGLEGSVSKLRLTPQALQMEMAEASGVVGAGARQGASFAGRWMCTLPSLSISNSEGGWSASTVQLQVRCLQPITMHFAFARLPLQVSSAPPSSQPQADSMLVHPQVDSNWEPTYDTTLTVTIGEYVQIAFTPQVAPRSESAASVLPVIARPLSGAAHCAAGMLLNNRYSSGCWASGGYLERLNVDCVTRVSARGAPVVTVQGQLSVASAHASVIRTRAPGSLKTVVSLPEAACSDMLLAGSVQTADLSDESRLAARIRIGTCSKQVQGLGVSGVHCHGWRVSGTDNVQLLDAQVRYLWVPPSTFTARNSRRSDTLAIGSMNVDIDGTGLLAIQPNVTLLLDSLALQRRQPQTNARTAGTITPHNRNWDVFCAQIQLRCVFAASQTSVAIPWPATRHHCPREAAVVYDVPMVPPLEPHVCTNAATPLTKCVVLTKLRYAHVFSGGVTGKDAVWHSACVDQLSVHVSDNWRKRHLLKAARVVAKACQQQRVLSVAVDGLRLDWSLVIHTLLTQVAGVLWARAPPSTPQPALPGPPTSESNTRHQPYAVDVTASHTQVTLRLTARSHIQADIEQCIAHTSGTHHDITILGGRMRALGTGADVVTFRAGEIRQGSCPGQLSTKIMLDACTVCIPSQALLGAIGYDCLATYKILRMLRHSGTGTVAARLNASHKTASTHRISLVATESKLVVEDPDPIRSALMGELKRSMWVGSSPRHTTEGNHFASAGTVTSTGAMDSGTVSMPLLWATVQDIDVQLTRAPLSYSEHMAYIVKLDEHRYTSMPAVCPTSDTSAALAHDRQECPCYNPISYGFKLPFTVEVAMRTERVRMGVRSNPDVCHSLRHPIDELLSANRFEVNGSITYAELLPDENQVAMKELYVDEPDVLQPELALLACAPLLAQQYFHPRPHSMTASTVAVNQPQAAMSVAARAACITKVAPAMRMLSIGYAASTVLPKVFVNLKTSASDVHITYGPEMKANLLDVAIVLSRISLIAPASRPVMTRLVPLPTDVEGLHRHTACADTLQGRAPDRSRMEWWDRLRYTVHGNCTSEISAVTLACVSPTPCLTADTTTTVPLADYDGTVGLQFSSRSLRFAVNAKEEGVSVNCTDATVHHFMRTFRGGRSSHSVLDPLWRQQLFRAPSLTVHVVTRVLRGNENLPAWVHYIPALPGIRATVLDYAAKSIRTTLSVSLPGSSHILSACATPRAPPRSASTNNGPDDASTSDPHARIPRLTLAMRDMPSLLRTFALLSSDPSAAPLFDLKQSGRPSLSSLLHSTAISLTAADPRQQSASAHTRSGVADTPASLFIDLAVSDKFLSAIELSNVDCTYKRHKGLPSEWGFRSSNFRLTLPRRSGTGNTFRSSGSPEADPGNGTLMTLKALSCSKCAVVIPTAVEKLPKSSVASDITEAKATGGSKQLPFLDMPQKVQPGNTDVAPALNVATCCNKTLSSLERVMFDERASGDVSSRTGSAAHLQQQSSSSGPHIAVDMQHMYAPWSLEAREFWMCFVNGLSDVMALRPAYSWQPFQASALLGAASGSSTGSGTTATAKRSIFHPGAVVPLLSFMADKVARELFLHEVCTHSTPNSRVRPDFIAHAAAVRAKLRYQVQQYFPEVIKSCTQPQFTNAQRSVGSPLSSSAASSSPTLGMSAVPVAITLRLACNVAVLAFQDPNTPICAYLRIARLSYVLAKAQSSLPRLQLARLVAAATAGKPSITSPSGSDSDASLRAPLLRRYLFELEDVDVQISCKESQDHILAGADNKPASSTTRSHGTSGIDNDNGSTVMSLGNINHIRWMNSTYMQRAPEPGISGDTAGPAAVHEVVENTIVIPNVVLAVSSTQFFAILSILRRVILVPLHETRAAQAALLVTLRRLYTPLAWHSVWRLTPLKAASHAYPQCLLPPDGAGFPIGATDAEIHARNRRHHHDYAYAFDEALQAVVAIHATHSSKVLPAKLMPVGQARGAPLCLFTDLPLAAAIASNIFASTGGGAGTDAGASLVLGTATCTAEPTWLDDATFHSPRAEPHDCLSDGAGAVWLDESSCLDVGTGALGLKTMQERSDSSVTLGTFASPSGTTLQWNQEAPIDLLTIGGGAMNPMADTSSMSAQSVDSSDAHTVKRPEGASDPQTSTGIGVAFPSEVSSTSQPRGFDGPVSQQNETSATSETAASTQRMPLQSAFLGDVRVSVLERQRQRQHVAPFIHHRRHRSHLSDALERIKAAPTPPLLSTQLQLLANNVSVEDSPRSRSEPVLWFEPGRIAGCETLNPEWKSDAVSGAVLRDRLHAIEIGIRDLSLAFVAENDRTVGVSAHMAAFQSSMRQLPALALRYSMSVGNVTCVSEGLSHVGEEATILEGVVENRALAPSDRMLYAAAAFSAPVTSRTEPLLQPLAAAHFMEHELPLVDVVDHVDVSLYPSAEHTLHAYLTPKILSFITAFFFPDAEARDKYEDQGIIPIAPLGVVQPFEATGVDIDSVTGVPVTVTGTVSSGVPAVGALAHTNGAGGVLERMRQHSQRLTSPRVSSRLEAVSFPQVPSTPLEQSPVTPKTPIRRDSVSSETTDNTPTLPANAPYASAAPRKKGELLVFKHVRFGQVNAKVTLCGFWRKRPELMSLTIPTHVIRNSVLSWYSLLHAERTHVRRAFLLALPRLLSKAIGKVALAPLHKGFSAVRAWRKHDRHGLNEAELPPQGLTADTALESSDADHALTPITVGASALRNGSKGSDAGSGSVNKMPWRERGQDADDTGKYGSYFSWPVSLHHLLPAMPLSSSSEVAALASASGSGSPAHTRLPTTRSTLLATGPSQLSQQVPVSTASGPEEVVPTPKFRLGAPPLRAVALSNSEMAAPTSSSPPVPPRIQSEQLWNSDAPAPPPRRDDMWALPPPVDVGNGLSDSDDDTHTLASQHNAAPTLISQDDAFIGGGGTGRQGPPRVPPRPVADPIPTLLGPLGVDSGNNGGSSSRAHKMRAALTRGVHAISRRLHTGTGTHTEAYAPRTPPPSPQW